MASSKAAEQYRSDCQIQASRCHHQPIPHPRCFKETRIRQINGCSHPIWQRSCKITRPQLGKRLKIFKGKDNDDKVDAALDRLLVEFGSEILKIVPGKVSTEVDARFSFDTKASINKALHIIEVGNCRRSCRRFR